MYETIPIYSKLISESLLSLYPVFVKKINLSIDLQLWTRLITYVLISLFFINYSWISSNLFTQESVGLSLVNLLHIYSSYKGFLNLDSGVAFSIFNIYPLLILLFSGVGWKIEYFYSIIGLVFFILSNFLYSNKQSESSNFAFGFGMIILSAITEAMIYFIVKRIKTENNWNHLFIAYFLGSILMSLYVFKDYLIEYFSTNTETNKTQEEYQNEHDIFKDNKTENKISYDNLGTIGLALIINGLIGTIGYVLRFYSTYRLEPGTYAILSYFGIIMAYFYGIVFNGEALDWAKVMGTIFIVLSNYLVL
jgi:drug/metabolite transporter (DMT)-like permease